MKYNIGYVIINGKGSSNWLWSTRVQSCFLSILTGQCNIVCLVVFCSLLNSCFKLFFCFFNILVEQQRTTPSEGSLGLLSTCLMYTIHISTYHILLLLLTVPM